MNAEHLTDMADTLQAAAGLLNLPIVLPDPYIEVSPRRPTTINVTVHGGFADFEVWRSALNIPVGDVRFNNGASNAYLSAVGAFSGATVQLTGFSSPLPAGER